MKHIVIAGGGFAGVRLARKLRKQKDIQVTLINDSADFRYSPALYRAVIGFKVGIARLPLEWMLIDSDNSNLIVGRVSGVDETRKQLELEDGRKIDYDEVVFALGSTTGYFNITGLDEFSYGAKSFSEVIELKHHIHDGLVKGSDITENFVIVGAGPTGVELAGALGAYLNHISKKHKIKHPHIQIYLVEAGPRILPQMHEAVSKKVFKRLVSLGVKIETDTKVQSETISKLKTSAGTIESKNVIWAAGTQNNPFFSKYPKIFAQNKKGKVAVNEHLQASANIYICGDNISSKYGDLAQTAIHHADYIANDIVARIKRRKRSTYKPKLPIQVVPVGPGWAVLQYGRLKLSGSLISLVRRAADIVGYTEVLGLIKASTIWTNSDRNEDDCSICSVR